MIYYDKEGREITFEEFVELFEGSFKTDYAIVARTKIGSFEVSTVWLGIDHSFGRGEKMIFETMVFGGELDTECWRYSTIDEARIGHEKACELVRLEIEACSSTGRASVSKTEG